MNATGAGVGFWYGPAGGATIALIGVIITVLVGLVLSERTHRWQLQDENRKIAHEHGEELYPLISKWGMAQISWFLQLRLVMRDQIDYNKYLDLYIEDNQNKDFKISKIEFLISVHFPELSDDWKKCVLFVQIASQTEDDFKQEYKTGMHRGEIYLPKLSKQVSEAQAEIERTLSNLVSSVSRISSHHL